MRQTDLLDGYKWLLSFGDRSEVDLRMERVRDQVRSVDPTWPLVPEQVSYGPIVDDRVSWYLLLARTSLEAPTNLDTVQASRVLPFIEAIGRNATVLGTVRNVEERVRRWLSDGERSNPDSTLFELLVAACYGRNGWDVEFIPETSHGPSPDIGASRDGYDLWAECKRLAFRSEASREEAAEWSRLWTPLKRELAARGLPLLLDVTFHLPMTDYRDEYLCEELVPKLLLVPGPGVVVDGPALTVAVEFVDLDRIDEELRQNYVKVGSTREIQLITGKYRPGTRFSMTALGSKGTIDDRGLGPSEYWSEMGFACGAFWSCDSPDTLQRKARDIRRQLAKATRQVAGGTRSTIHVGVETVDGDLVAETAYRRILKTVADFDAAGTELGWLYCHFFGPESPPDKEWEFAETTLWHRRDSEPSPIRDKLLVVPDSRGTGGAVHWEPHGTPYGA